MRICAIFVGLTLAGCSFASAPQNSHPPADGIEGSVFTDFGTLTLLNNCGQRVTLVGITAPADNPVPGSRSYQLRPANGEMIMVEIDASASLPILGRRLRVTGTPDCAITMYVGGHERATAVLRENNRSQPDAERP
jgi:hypothetical protein